MEPSTFDKVIVLVTAENQKKRSKATATVAMMHRLTAFASERKEVVTGVRFLLFHGKQTKTVTKLSKSENLRKTVLLFFIFSFR